MTDKIIMRCRQCSAKNRVPVDVRRARCGKCRTDLDPAPLLTGKVRIIDDPGFESQVLGAPIPVLLDCWADWCQPCRVLAPTLDAMAAEFKGRLSVCKLDIEANPMTASRLQVQSIPALFLYDNGKLVDKFIGLMPKETLVRKISPRLY
ncbi:MAG: thioredoxin domain-containing protein [Acidobacteriota bacterium]|nr:thioredoxin domain-containing protein [Acidobacteriota bacterium]